MLLEHPSGKHKKIVEVEEVAFPLSLFIGLDIVG